MPASLWWLCLGAFAIGTEGFMIAGLLPVLAADLGVSVPAAGQLVTVFAVTYAVGSPVMATLLGNVDRRRVLIGALAIFAAGNLLAATAHGFGQLMAARVLLALAGAAQLVGVAAGGRDPLQPLSGVMRASTGASAQADAHGVTFKRVKSSAELDAEVRNASASGRAVMLDFYADWCVSCKEMERLTFTDARVRTALAELVLLQADVTANSADDQALLKRFGLFGPPGTVFFDPQGKEVSARVIGFEPVDTFLEGLRRALIEQSARLFREKGYGNTTVRDIAAATGVHAGSWFYYFKTKQDILQAVIEHGLTVALADIEAIDIEDLPPREAMRQLVRAHLHTILAPHQDFIPVMLYEWRSLDAQAQERIIALKDRYESIWTRLMERLRASGDWAQPTPVDRLLMFGALNWTAQWYQAGAGISIDALADQAVLFILRTPAPPAA